MQPRYHHQPTPIWLFPIALLLAGGVIGALLVVWSVLPIVLLAFLLGLANGAYLGATRKQVAALFKTKLPTR